MQFTNLEVVVAILIFAGLIAFLALIYTSMRALISQAAHAIGVFIRGASNIFHGSRPSPSDTNRPPPVAPSEKPSAEDKY